MSAQGEVLDSRPAPRRPVNWFRWIVGGTVAVLVAIVVAGVLAIHGQNDGLNGQIQTQDTQMRAMRSVVQEQASEIAATNDTVSSLNSTVANLNQPSDPLSAYNSVCQQPMSNTQTGVSSTWYFPCTNSATTTPSPASTGGGS
jgi:hypothetical protein